MAKRSVQVLVIGAGPGGEVAAIRAGQLGLQTLVVEREQAGGVCVNWGCIPSKALIHAANLVSEMHEFAAFGIKAEKIDIDATALMAWKDGIVKKQRSGLKQLFTSNKVEYLAGNATITGPKTASVKPVGEGGGQAEEITFENLIIASGASVIQIPGFEYDDDLIGYAKHGVAYDPIPKRLVIIGGGVIGCELGTVYGKLGSQVTIVEMMPSIMPGTDPDLIRPVLKRMKKRGIEVITGAKAKGVKRKEARSEPASVGPSQAEGGQQDAPGVVEVEVDGAIKHFPADKVLVAVGFRPNAQGLGLEAAGVKVDPKGWILVDDRCRTNVANIYAVGDVTGAPLLAHRAFKMGEVAAEVIAGKPAAYDIRAMPLGSFTDPEIAQAGLTEAEARAKGYEVAVGTFPMAALGRAAATNATDGLVKVVIDKKTDVILGVGMAAAGACDLIAEACLALEMGALSEDIGLTVHTHPTLSEGLMEAARAAKGEAIHIVNRPEGVRRPQGAQPAQAKGA